MDRLKREVAFNLRVGIFQSLITLIHGSPACREIEECFDLKFLVFCFNKKFLKVHSFGGESVMALKKC